MEPIYSAGTLKKLVDTLFKGIDGVLGRALEYQNDYGKLKAKTAFEMRNKDGDEFTMIVSLSPIKDKDGFFYLETSFDGLSESEINKMKYLDKINKVVYPINKGNSEALNSLIKQFMKANKLEEVEIHKSVKDDNIADQLAEEIEDMTLLDDRNKIQFHPKVTIADGELSIRCPSPATNDDNKFDFTKDYEDTEAAFEDFWRTFLDSNLLREAEDDDNLDEYEEVTASTRVLLCRDGSNVDMITAATNVDNILPSVVSDDALMMTLYEEPTAYELTEGVSNELVPIEDIRNIDDITDLIDKFASIIAVAGVKMQDGDELDSAKVDFLTAIQDCFAILTESIDANPTVTISASLDVDSLKEGLDDNFIDDSIISLSQSVNSRFMNSNSFLAEIGSVKAIIDDYMSRKTLGV